MMGGQEFQSTHPRGVRRSDAGELARHRSRFNPRTRVGCDVAYQVACDGYNMFQSTHPRGVRPDSEPAGSTGGSVSIHAPAWGATRRGSHQISASGGFNPRTRVGCDPSRNCMSSLTCRFQSTHPRGVRLRERFSIDSMDEFQSTHPRGVRLANVLWQQVMVPVSIHAPAWGATGGSSLCVRNRPEFQSTHPRGVRREMGHIEWQGSEVSIHAPAWGATRTGEGDQWRVVFQSTHPRGVRQDHSPVVVTQLGFQSTHPRGVRHFRGCGLGHGQQVSIHAPAWGATRSQGVGRRPSCVSIHAPAWGATFRAETPTVPLPMFQSTHPRGVRPLPGLGPRWFVRFQSTHPRGVRLWRVMEDIMAIRVSIHAPAWGATTTGILFARSARCFNPRTRVGCDSRLLSSKTTSYCFNPRTRVGCDHP